MSTSPALRAMRDALHALQQETLSISEFCRQWRSQKETLDSLPAPYRQVMEDLLGRLEAGSLFTEESCSFSQQDLHAHLAVWLDKADALLARRG